MQRCECRFHTGKTFFSWFQWIPPSGPERFRSECQSKNEAKMPLLATLHDHENHGNTAGFIAFWLCRRNASGSRRGVNGLCECKVPCEPNASFSNAELVFLKSQPASARPRVECRETAGDLSHRSDLPGGPQLSKEKKDISSHGRGWVDGSMGRWVDGSWMGRSSVGRSIDGSKVMGHEQRVV